MDWGDQRRDSSTTYSNITGKILKCFHHIAWYPRYQGFSPLYCCKSLTNLPPGHLHHSRPLWQRMASDVVQRDKPARQRNGVNVPSFTLPPPPSPRRLADNAVPTLWISAPALCRVTMAEKNWISTISMMRNPAVVNVFLGRTAHSGHPLVGWQTNQSRGRMPLFWRRGTLYEIKSDQHDVVISSHLYHFTSNWTLLS